VLANTLASAVPAEAATLIDIAQPRAAIAQAVPVDRGCSETDISDFVARLRANRQSEWAQKNFRSIVLDLIGVTRARCVMEIGAGRRPAFNADQTTELGIRYFANDISEEELARAPGHVRKAQFDIGGVDQRAIAPFLGAVDVMFSRMVFEHLRDTRRAYQNVYNLLSPGGVCLNHHPVLYSPPFLINAVLPEAVSSRLLRLVFPRRRPGVSDKFPAWYHKCSIAEKTRRQIQEIGFRHVWQIPLFYHPYFKSLPGLYQLDRALSRLADRKQLDWLASYCLTIAYK
jgi:SAM-dependent methyltransferase